MLTQTEATIFLSGTRGLQQTEGFRSYQHFNFGGNPRPDKAAFGSLYVFNDDTLAGGRSCKLTVEEDSIIFLLPTVGKLGYTNSHGQRTELEAGSCQRMFNRAGTTIEITNPYPDELINYVHIWFRMPVGNQDIRPRLCNFDMARQLTSLFPGELPALPNVSIGKLRGRSEGVYTISAPTRGIYCFVIEGAFEIAYRLLESRDGLALWDSREVEYEALSDDAILLVVEVPL